MARLRATGIVFAILSTLLIAFPPWYGEGRNPRLGHEFLFDPPYWCVHIDVARLVVQLAGAVSASFLVGFVIVPFGRALAGKIARLWSSHRH